MGVCNPAGEAADYNGLYFTAAELRELAAGNCGQRSRTVGADGNCGRKSPGIPHCRPQTTYDEGYILY